MACKRETPIVKAILEALAAKRVWAWRTNSGVIIGEFTTRNRSKVPSGIGSSNVLAVEKSPGWRSRFIDPRVDFKPAGSTV